jgi:hypothetical protein
MTVRSAAKGAAHAEAHPVGSASTRSRLLGVLGGVGLLAGAVLVLEPGASDSQALTPPPKAAVAMPLLSAVAAQAPAPKELSETSPAQEDQRVQAYFEQLERLWRTEPRDEAWSKRVEPILTKTMGTHQFLKDATEVSVECRSTFCRVQAQVAGPGRDNLLHVLQVASELPEASSRRLPDQSTVAYLAKKALPEY